MMGIVDLSMKTDAAPPELRPCRPPHRRRSGLALLALVPFFLSACGTSEQASDASQAHAQVGADFGKRIVNADAEPQNWLSTGRNYQETRFSPLTSVSDQNVGKLGLAWSYDLDTDRGQEATPLIVDGVIYTTSAWSKVQALDAVSGKLLWQFDPQVPKQTLVKSCCDAVNRGAAYWNGKVFVGTLDGRLIAIDAKTGKSLWSTVTVDQSKPYTITGAPRIVKGMVMIGNGGAEQGVRGYVSAYDAETGAQRWRFYTVPGEPGKRDGAASDAVLARVATNTWSGKWWTKSGGGGGGTVWDSMAYDPQLDLLYIGVGNAAYWNQRFRSPDGGDNLFVASVLALKPETGEYVWHYQETPGDRWDYTATQNMILADLKMGGKVRKVLLHAPKNGFFYVMDRATGELLSAKPIVKVNWALGIDSKTKRPIINPEARYDETGRPFLAHPGGHGSHSWQPMAFSPLTGLVYIPVQLNALLYTPDPSFKPLPLGTNLGVFFDTPDDSASLRAIRNSMGGYLLAWDPVANREVWRAPHPGNFNGGVLATAGNLVVQGDVDGVLNVYNAKTGLKLWSFDVGSAILAAPVTFSVNGQQYVTVLSGWGGAPAVINGPFGWSKSGIRPNKSRVLTFVLGGTKSLPPIQQAALPAVPVPAQLASPQVIQEGRNYYARTCISCHGPSVISGHPAVPDLRYSALMGDTEAWKAVVYDGILSDQGMVGFKANYSPAQIEAIRAYVIERAKSRKDFAR